jgi:hypothetical protein
LAQGGQFVWYLQVILELENSQNKGFQLSKGKGLLNSTWLLYKRQDFYFYFDINQKIEFIDRYKYSKEELIKEFENSYFTIDDIIN